VDFISQDASRIREWSSMLPENPIVHIATARLLLELGRREEAEAVFELIKDEKVRGKVTEREAAIALAARAEAFALESRWREADQFYRQAIEVIDDPTIARSWWFNLADISYHFDNEMERQAALRAASNFASNDEITRRSTEIQRALPRRSSGMKAN